LKVCEKIRRKTYFQLPFVDSMIKSQRDLAREEPWARVTYDVPDHAAGGEGGASRERQNMEKEK
jgi:hypothetical protein